jgi:hypothetical protein
VARSSVVQSLEPVFNEFFSFSAVVGPALRSHLVVEVFDKVRNIKNLGGFGGGVLSSDVLIGKTRVDLSALVAGREDDSWHLLLGSATKEREDGLTAKNRARLYLTIQRGTAENAPVPGLGLVSLGSSAANMVHVNCADLPCPLVTVFPPQHPCFKELFLSIVPERTMTGTFARQMGLSGAMNAPAADPSLSVLPFNERVLQVYKVHLLC